MDETGFGELRRGWRTMVAATVGIGTSLTTFAFYTTGLFLQPLSEEFGWRDSDIMLAVTIVLLGASASGPLIGMVTDRLGARRVALWSVAGAAVGWMSLALTNGHLVWFYATFCLLTLLGAGTLPVTWTRSVVAQFDRHRGLALGICLVGTGIFGTGIKLLAFEVMGHFGWRGAYVAIGAMLLLVTWPITWVFLRQEAAPDAPADPRARAVPAVRNGLTLREALRGRAFWLMALAFLFLSLSIGGIQPNLERFLTNSGFDTATAVRIASCFGIGIIVGRLCTGVLLDRFWAPLVVLVILLPSCASFLLLAHGVSSVPFAMGMIFMVGTAAGVEYDALAYLVSRYFGQRAYSAIYGSVYIGFAIGAGVGPLIFSRFSDLGGGYGLLLYCTAAVLLIGCVLLLLLGRYPAFAERDGDPAIPTH